MPNLAGPEVIAEGSAEPAESVTPLIATGRGIMPARRGRWWRDARRRRLLALADMSAASLATLIVIVAGTGTFWAFLFLPLWPILAKMVGLYDRDHRALRHLTADEVPSILGWVAMTTTAVVLLLSLTPAGMIEWDLGLALFVAAAVTAIGFRALTRWLWWRLTPPELVGLVGDGPVLASLQRKFELFKEMHLQLAAVREIDALGIGREREEGLRDLTRRVDRIVVAANGVEADLIGYLKDLCRSRQVKISVVSPLARQGPSFRAVRPARRLADPRVQHLGPVPFEPAVAPALRLWRGADRPDRLRADRRDHRDRNQDRQSRAGAVLADPLPASTAGRSGCTSCGR